MKPATMYTQTKTFIECPDCGKTDGFSVGHLFNTNCESFGPWACDNCGLSIRGEINADQNVCIEIVERRRQRQGLMLVEIAYDGYEQDGKRPIYLIFDQTIYSSQLNADGSMEEDINQYWVDEHTCPTNILRNLEIIDGTDTDPHGILQHVQTIFKPEDFDHTHMTYAGWCALFDKLPGGAVIEGEIVQSEPKYLSGTVGKTDIRSLYRDPNAEPSRTDEERLKNGVWIQYSPSEPFYTTTAKSREFIGDTSGITLLYNHVMRLGLPDPITTPTKPFASDDQLELGTLYVEKSGFTCRMTLVIGEERGEYKFGYRFVGNNGCYYKANGTTSISDEQTELNDIVAIVLEENDS